jgi:16S rRNA (cytosine1402-N4)-methyltransferase
VDAVLLDLGVSSLQLRDANRGFSFMEEGPLDMRMDPDSGPTALQWIAEQTEESLANALFTFGEERASRPIARNILRMFNDGRLHSTYDLAQAIYKVLPRDVARRKKQIDPATRTFQAIRIAVNGELSRLATTLENAVASLKVGGRLGVISFHSLEDRIAKQTLRRLAGVYDGPGRTSPVELPRLIKLVHAGGLKPTEAECAANPPSRSARLRIGERLRELDTDTARPHP